MPMIATLTISFGLAWARLRLGKARASPAVAAAVFERKTRRFMPAPFSPRSTHVAFDLMKNVYSCAIIYGSVACRPRGTAGAVNGSERDVTRREAPPPD